MHNNAFPKSEIHLSKWRNTVSIVSKLTVDTYRLIYIHIAFEYKTLNFFLVMERGGVIIAYGARSL